MMTKILTTAEVAEALDTDGRTLRKFLRTDEGRSAAALEANPGKGHRYAIEAKRIRTLKSKFAAWEAARRVPTQGDEVPTEGEDDEVTEGEVEVTEGDEMMTDEVIFED